MKKNIILKKAIIIYLILIIVLLASMGTYIYGILIKSNLRHEKVHTLKSLDSYKKIINKEIKSLDVLCKNHAYRDDIYEFVRNENKDYLKSNFLPTDFEDNRIDFVIIADNSGNTLYSQAYDYENKKPAAVSPDIKDFLNNNPQLLFAGISYADKVSGIFNVSDKYVIYSSNKIIKSNNSGPALGSLIMGRYLDENTLSVLSEITGSQIKFLPIEEIMLSDGKTDVAEEISRTKTYYIYPESDSMMNAFIPVADFRGDIIGAFQVNITRDIFLEGMSNILDFSFLVLISIILFTLLSALFIQKIVIKRITNLNNAVNEVNVRELSEINYKDNGRDEISNLASSIKIMLHKIKESNLELKYLKFYDKLTGLYNRSYLEEEIRRLDNSRNLPLSIILVDINGLRIINDAFGTKTGNGVLKKTANCLKNSCRKGEIVARWGGDEFIIVLPSTSKEDTEKIAERIVQNCLKMSYKNVIINVSIGISIKLKPNEDIQDIIIEAETRLYRHKLFEKDSVSSSIILSLERTLWAKSSETEEHAERLKKMSVAIGKQLGLSTNQLDDLKLLSSLHDLGKVGISEAILTKKEKLDDRDWEIIKKHPDIGYQIAKSSPQLSHIAECILHHHEWWNGTGYPGGLKGEKIPLLSRIISIVDAFDVMINGRIYKNPVTVQEAINELQRSAGRQFDPQLVKLFVKIITEGEIVSY